MTVAELMADLQQIDGSRLVVLAKDGEGNGYTPLAGWWEGRYQAETTWCGRVGLEALTEEDREAGYGPDDVLSGGVPAVILKPTY